MQFSKFTPLLCAAAFCAGSISVRADDTPAQAAARAALEQKMNELDAQQPAQAGATPPVVVVTSSGVAPEPSALPSAGNPSDNQAQAAALAALQREMAELDKQQPETTGSDAFFPDSATKPASQNYAGKKLGFKPIEAPPLPISAAKQSQLQALLVKYKADQVTPEEYQAQRAAILAQP